MALLCWCRHVAVPMYFECRFALFFGAANVYRSSCLRLSVNTRGVVHLSGHSCECHSMTPPHHIEQLEGKLLELMRPQYCACMPQPSGGSRSIAQGHVRCVKKTASWPWGM
jgi:hypothetical protein